MSFPGLLEYNAALFFILFARIMAMLMIAPLASSRAIPTVARVSLALLTVFIIYPWVSKSGVYTLPPAGLVYAGILLAEVMIGIIMGFVLVIFFSIFIIAGQFFTVQMGFGASQVFDPLGQVSIPLIGQFLNMVAMLIFLTTGGFQRIFYNGIYQSFVNIQPLDFLVRSVSLHKVLLADLSYLFQHGLVIAFPILGTLFLVMVTVGLFGKAAPQMNLMMVGFPIQIGVGFIILIASIPFFTAVFSRVIDRAFIQLQALIGGTL